MRGGVRLFAFIAIVALLITAVSCKQVYVVFPPEVDESIETFIVTDLDSLLDAVRTAGDGDTIDFRNVSINPEWNRLPLRLRHDVNITGSINISSEASTISRSLDDEEIVSSRALGENASSLFEINSNANISFDSFIVTVDESSEGLIKSIISIERGNAAFSNITVSGDVAIVEIGVYATADSISGNLTGLTITVNPDNPSSFEIAQEIADKTGSIPTVGDDTFAVIDSVQNTGYTTLEEAFANAIDSSIIKLGTDIVADNPFVLDEKDLTLDLNGKTISGSDTIVAQSGIILIRNDSSIIIDDSSESKTGIINGNTDRIYGPDNYYAIFSPIGIWPEDGHKASLTINNGTFIGSYYGVVGSGNCIEEDCTNIIINGGSFTGNDGSAIYHPQNGSLIINGGEFVGSDTAIEIRSGNLSITGGEFTAIKTPANSNPNGSGTTSIGSAIAIAQHTTRLPISVNISGGTFNGYSAIYESNPQNNPQESIELISLAITDGIFNATNGGIQVIESKDFNKFISGGTFNIKPDDKYIAEGYASEKTENGWIIDTYRGKAIYSEDDFERREIISIGGVTGYDDKSAIILEGDVKLMTDITTEHIIYIPEGSSAVLDLNGHVIESQFLGYSVGNFGNLTVNDSSSSDDSRGSGIIFNSSKIRDENNFGHDAIRNFGVLTINGGTFGDSNIDTTDSNDTTFGASIRNIGDATINNGYFTCVDNYGYWENESGTYTYSYAIRSSGTLIINGGYIYGRMNGGISADDGEIRINDCEVDVYGETSFHTLTIDNSTNGTFSIYDGIFRNTDTTRGHVFSVFNDMPSWEIGASRAELEAAGYFIYGGTFIEDGQEILITD